MRTLYYDRHFILLAGMAALLAATSPWRPWHGAIASFAVYGALHASSIALTLRASKSTAAKLSFVAGSGCLSLLTAGLCLFGSRSVGGAHGIALPALLVTLASGMGAAGYAGLLRLFGANLSLGGLGSITLGCALTTAAVFSLGVFARGGLLGFAVCWWFAFSATLWFHDGGR